jgi:phytoene synthase
MTKASYDPRGGASSLQAAAVRRYDPDRFLTALFAPPERRETLFLLYAFNHELARAREVVSEPTLALIRLQWWREVVEGARRRHEVAGPLGEALDQGLLDAADLLAMIEGREAEAEPGMPTLAAWLAYLRATAGGVAAAAGRVLGADAEARERLRALGTAYGVAGQLRSVAALARQGRCMLPEEVLAAHGLTVHEVIADPHAARLLPLLRTLAEEGRRLLRDAGGRVPRAIVAAALPAVLARRDLRRVGEVGGPRGIGDRLAVLAAAVAGRC